jgi:hypothetical protein
MGMVTLPDALCEICYLGLPEIISARMRDTVSSADIALIEIGTPIEFSYKGFVFNQNLLRAFLVNKFKPLDEQGAVVAKNWLAALQKRSVPLQKNSAPRCWTYFRVIRLTTLS